MFYCDRCRVKRKWPMSLFKSHGPCELCRTVTGCNDIAAKDLPVPPLRGLRRLGYSLDYDWSGIKSVITYHGKRQDS